QPGRSARNVRVGGEPLAGTRALRDGDVVAFDRARLECRVAGSALTIRIDWIVTAGDTAPPDLDVVARGSRGAEIAITPIAFKPATTAEQASRRVGKGTIGVATAGVLLAAVAWFAFTAKSVALDIQPPPTAMSLPSTLLKLKLGDRFLLRSGSHRVAAELPGYYPLDTNVEVGPLSRQTIELNLTKLPGLVTITTEPEVAAQVSVDGMPLGMTPLVDAELTPGVHRLEFNAPRHLAEVRELEVGGGGERQSLAATLTPAYAVVSLRTDPPGATVLVDGAETGVTPAEIEIDSGEHELEVRLAGYNAWSDKILVAANQPQQLPDVKLALADGRVELASAPSEASVSVDGEFRGRTPLSLRLAPGRAHRVTLTKPGYETAARELSVGADSGRRLQVELTPQLGQIEVVSTPPNAEVWVGGERRGTTPTTLELTAVSQDIELRLAGYAQERADLTPRPGYPQKLERTLVALNEASGGGFAQSIRTTAKQELKLVPAGQFTMGSSRREVGRRSNEMLRPVRVTRAFYLGVNEVTNAEFRAFKPDHDSGEFGGESLNGDDQPVANVTWDDAVEYLNWLSIKDGLQPVYEAQANGWAAVRPLRNGYRLPTEAEWEWAARFAGQEAALHYPWGAELPPPDRSGNYADVTASRILPSVLVTYNDGASVAAPVGRYAANSYGIFDLGGNVAEWVQDLYAPDVVETTERVDDPLGPDTGRLHVVRGASWRSATVTDLRLAARGSGTEGRDDVGFRIARNLQK
ncbi:MAG TPA: PEGA domain-containing protein, partial [Gammaproteobacteria bacterium]|nr:PEGA domain-containing protein [Gammaproteobacteria bacterium]